jgi:hypothetical protein
MLESNNKKTYCSGNTVYDFEICQFILKIVITRGVYFQVESNFENKSETWLTTKRLDFCKQITFESFFFVKSENIEHNKIHQTFGFYFSHFEVISLNHT